MFFVGFVGGFILGALWMLGARILVKMRRDNIVAPKSAPNNARDAILRCTERSYCPFKGWSSQRDYYCTCKVRKTAPVA